MPEDAARFEVALFERASANHVVYERYDVARCHIHMSLFARYYQPRLSRDDAIRHMLSSLFTCQDGDMMRAMLFERELMAIRYTIILRNR